MEKEYEPVRSNYEGFKEKSKKKLDKEKLKKELFGWNEEKSEIEKKSDVKKKSAISKTKTIESEVERELCVSFKDDEWAELVQKEFDEFKKIREYFSNKLENYLKQANLDELLEREKKYKLENIHSPEDYKVKSITKVITAIKKYSDYFSEIDLSKIPKENLLKAYYFLNLFVATPIYKTIDNFLDMITDFYEKRGKFRFIHNDAMREKVKIADSFLDEKYKKIFSRIEEIVKK